jgi:DNA polymerase-3 subunit gamma/tau
MDQAIAFCGDTITHNELLQALNVVGTERLFEFMDCVKEHDADRGLELINTLLQEGYDIQEYLIGLTEHLRNLYIAHETSKLYLVEASEETKKRYLQTAPDFSRDDLMRMLHIISEAQIKLKDASQPRIQFEITLLKLIHMERSEQLSELLAGLQELKKNSNNFISTSENGSSKKEPSEAENISESPSKEEKPEETEPQTKEVDETSSEIDTAAQPQEDHQEEEEEFEAEEADYDEAEFDEDEEEDDFDIGAPALATSLAKKSRVASSPSEQKKTADIELASAQKEEAQTPEKITLEFVEKNWPKYLESLKGDYPMLLHLQMDRVKLLKLKGGELYLECDNEFAKKMLDEQCMDLQKKLKECVGSLLRFNITVGEQSEENKPMSVYERFKQIQQKDPIIRDIVEIFGAELEY